MPVSLRERSGNATVRLPTLYVFACAFSFALSLSVAHAQYTITDLGAITTNGQSRGYGTNNLGEVAGSSDGHAFFWTGECSSTLGCCRVPPAKGAT